MTMFLTLRLENEQATEQLAQKFARVLRAGELVFLSGDLGAGKTTFTRHLIRALGLNTRVKSPTYTLVEAYELPRWQVYHFDLYRLADPEELEFMGIRDYFGPDCLCLVEWPEKAAGYVPPADLALVFSFPDEAVHSGRRLELFARSEVGQKCLNELSKFQLGAGGS